MKKPTKNILLLFCGGTISMGHNPITGVLDSSYQAQQFFQLEPRLGEIADISVENLFDIDSTNMTPRMWEHIVTAVSQNYDDYDSFVITMGTDTMSYASSALAFALHDIGKPVIITGAQIPSEAINTDARQNLINSLTLASMNLSGVYILFGSKIIKGCRAEKASESELNAFATFNEHDFGEISLGVRFHMDPPPLNSQPPRITNGFEPKVACVTCVPGMDTDLLFSLLDLGYKGVVLRGFGSGNTPENLLPFFEETKKREIPVAVSSQCPRGTTIMGLYDPSFRAIEAGAIQTFDMSREAAVTKMMWLLRQETPYKEFKKRMQTNLVGEINIDKARPLVNDKLLSLPEYKKFSPRNFGDSIKKKPA